MADIASWSPVDESNTAAPPDGWPENMQPSAVNNSARALMGGVRRWYDTITAQVTDIYGRLGTYLPLSGGTITGNLTVNGALVGANPISTTGPNAAYSFADRTGGGSWLWYATGGIARLWMSGDKVTVDTGGNIIAAGNINGQTLTGSQLTSTANINAGTNITAGFDVFAGRNLGVTGTAFAAIVDCSGKVNASFYDCDNVRVIDTTTGIPFVYRQGGVWAIQLQNFNTYYDNAGHIFRNQGAANIFTIDASGNANATAQLQGASIYSRGNIDAAGNIAASGTLYTAGTITAVGAVNSPRFQGGAGGAANLAMYGTANTVNFRFDPAGTGQVAYRIDGTLEKYIGSTVNFLDSQLAYPGGGPTNAVIGAHDFPGTWYYAFIDYVSDERIKSNIAPTQVDALDIIKQVPVVSFDVRPEVTEIFRSLRMHGRDVPASSDHIPIGLVAQRLQALIPEAVYVGPQPGDNDLPEDCHNITLPAITPYLIRAVQQLAARLEALEGQTRTER